MAWELSFLPQSTQLANDEQKLRACSQVSSRFGLVLSDKEIAGLVRQRFTALKQTGRVEFGEGILPRLAQAFCDSPYVSPGSWADTLAALQQIFYQLKGECRERLSDDELLQAMVLLYNRRAHGSLEYLESSSPELLADAANGILPPGSSLSGWEDEDDGD